VPVWPQAGEKINKAIERIASGQADAATAMKSAQAESIEDIKKAGVKL
jgi:multiple sugar transport system substrate-binding protein